MSHVSCCTFLLLLVTCMERFERFRFSVPTVGSFWDGLFGASVQSYYRGSVPVSVLEKRFWQFFGNGPNTVPESTVSNTELSEFFCPHRVPGRELSEFLSAYYLCASQNSPSFSQNSPSLSQTQ